MSKIKKITCCNECSSDPHGNDYSYKEHCVDQDCSCHWPDPIEAIRFRMGQMGWNQSVLVRAGCGSRSHVSEILNRKRKLNLNFIRAYHKIADATPLKVLIKDYKL